MTAVRMDAKATLRRRNDMRENALQEQIADHLGWCYPRLLWWHCPNGGKRDEGTARGLVAMGVRAGVPDLAMILPGGIAGFIELKATGGRSSVHQLVFATQAVALGARHATAKSLDDVIGTLSGWGIEPARKARLDGKIF